MLQSINFVTRKRNQFSRLESIRNSAALEDGLIGFLIYSFNEIDPFDQTIEININSVIQPMSEQYINKEKVFNAYDSDEEFYDSENLDFNRE